MSGSPDLLKGTAGQIKRIKVEAVRGILRARRDYGEKGPDLVGGELPRVPCGLSLVLSYGVPCTSGVSVTDCLMGLQVLLPGTVTSDFFSAED